jgi:hypothetical protein
MRRRYLRAGRPYKSRRVTELVELFGYHRKAALRALRPKPVLARAPFVRGRPKEYSPEQLLPPLKAIWLAALQPCGVRRKACLPEWLADYEADHRRLDARRAPGPALGQSRHAGSAAAPGPHRAPPPGHDPAPAVVAPGIIGRAKALVARIKVAPGYTEAIGQALRVIGAEQTVDVSTLKPVITAAPNAGRVVIGWTKQGMDGLEIWRLDSAN